MEPQPRVVLPARISHIHNFRIVAHVIRVEIIAKREQVTPGNEVVRPRQGHIDGIGEILVELQTRMGLFRRVKLLQNGRLVAISETATRRIASSVFPILATFQLLLCASISLSISDTLS